MKEAFGSGLITLGSQKKINRLPGRIDRPLITTIAGTGIEGFSGDNGDPNSATFRYPDAMAFDSVGNLYFTDEGTNCIRKITFGTNPVITTVAGTGAYGFSGDGGDPVWLGN